MEDGRMTLFVPWYCLKGTKIAHENNCIITVMHSCMSVYVLPNIIFSEVIQLLP